MSGQRAVGARQFEPHWLRALLQGDLTPEVPIAAGSTGGDDNFGSPAMAELACVAALSGRATSGDVRLLDPTVGCGVIVQTVASAVQLAGSDVNVIGIDVDAEALREAQRSSATSRAEWSLQLGNVLTDSLLERGSAELVVSEPPLGLDWRAIAETVKAREGQGWYPHGTGRVSDAGWLFLQRGIAAMRSREGGGSRFVTFVNPSLLYDREGMACRKWLVDNDLVEAIVQLPAELARYTSLPFNLLVFRTDKPEGLIGKAHVIDLRGFMTTRDRGARRRISEEGLRRLWAALETRRPGPSNRVVSLRALVRQSVFVSTSSTPSVSFRAEVSSADPGGDVRGRYGPVPVDWNADGPSFVSFRIGQFFDRPAGVKTPRGNAFTRLSALLTAPPESLIAGIGKDDSSGDVVWLPTGRGAATTTTPTEVPGRILRLRVNADIVHPDYLAGWLNSDEGTLALQRALTRGATGQFIHAVRSDRRSLWRLVDELVVPVLPLAQQVQVAESLATLRRVESLVQSARADLWSGNQAAELVVGPFEPLLDRSLERWTASLPYPFATALWTLTSRNSVESRHRQIFHTWESYAAFLATVLLSALSQDSDLAEVECLGLRAALNALGLSLERPSLGVWNVVVQRLSARFRELLSADGDERERVVQLFGGAPPSVIEAIIQPACVQLLTDVNAKRNTWLGHSGAASDSTLHRHVEYLTSALEDLRSLVGEAWIRLPLVRARRAASRGGELQQDVELVMGTSVPFRPATFVVGSIMEEGELYLATDGCAKPVPLVRLIVLRAGSESDRFACYFFNRADADNVRLVSYQMTETGEINEPRREFADDLGWLWVTPAGT